jgi:hypothetical protein
MTNLEFITKALDRCIQDLQDHYDETEEFDPDAFSGDERERLETHRHALRCCYLFVERLFDTEEEAQQYASEVGNMVPVVERMEKKVVIRGTQSDLEFLGFRDFRHCLFDQRAE